MSSHAVTYLSWDMLTVNYIRYLFVYQEQELKLAADAVLCEVRKKQADVKRMQDVLRSLEKLRRLRKEAALRKGRTVIVVFSDQPFSQSHVTACCES